jgi:formylmethanofuran dehydrogenase subunit B
VEDRRVAAVDIYRTELARFCQLFVSLKPGEELALTQGVAAHLNGGSAPAQAPPQARELAEFLAQAAYSVIFLGRGVSYGPAAELLQTLAGVAAILNRRAPCALFPLSGDFNAAGLYQLFLRELGSPGAPDFGDPAGVASRFEPVDFREVDALLVAGADLLWSLPADQAEDLRRRDVPIVALSPFANRTTAQARVVLPVAMEGVETSEIACRMDGLPVVLKAFLPGPAPPAWRVLEDLLLCV